LRYLLLHQLIQFDPERTQRIDPFEFKAWLRRAESTRAMQFLRSS